MAVNKVVINRDGEETVLVDITDSTVTPETLAEGETAYAKNGEKIAGTLTSLPRVSLFGTDGGWYVGDDGKPHLVALGKSDTRGILGVGSSVDIDWPAPTWFGDATPDDVSAHASFTSADGIAMGGNLYSLYRVFITESERSDPVHIDGSGKLYVVLSGKATERGILDVDGDVSIAHPLSSFGDVKRAEVMYGKTFTSADGICVSGTGGEKVVVLETSDIRFDPGNATVGHAYASVENENGLLLQPNATVEVQFSTSSFGNATPEDVVAGKVFSSAAGIQSVGTLEVGPGSIEVTDDGNGNLTIMNAVVTDNGGNINVTM